jgi:hypothetical protein
MLDVVDREGAVPVEDIKLNIATVLPKYFHSSSGFWKHIEPSSSM